MGEVIPPPLSFLFFFFPLLTMAPRDIVGEEAGVGDICFSNEIPPAGRGGSRAAGSTKSVRMLWWHHLKINRAWLKANLLVGAAGALGWDPSGAGGS